MAQRIMIIRHAEKPDDDNDIGLSEAGRMRAHKLIGLFGYHGRLSGVWYLFATDRSRHSNRSFETLQPLADALGYDISHDYDDDEYKSLARRIKTGKKYEDAVILIAWHHGNIPALAKALGVRAADLPWKTWPDNVFDQVWIIDISKPGLVPMIRAEAQGV